MEKKDRVQILEYDRYVQIIFPKKQYGIYKNDINYLRWKIRMSNPEVFFLPLFKNVFSRTYFP